MDKNEVITFKVGDMVRTKKVRNGVRLCQNVVPHYSRCTSCCLFGKEAFKVIGVKNGNVILEFRTSPKCERIEGDWQSISTIERAYKWVKMK